MWLGSASGAMGIWTLPVFCRGGLGAFSAGDRRRVEAVSADCRGQNRSYAAVMVRHGDYREQRDGEHGHCRPIAGAAEVQHWGGASNLI